MVSRISRIAPRGLSVRLSLHSNTQRSNRDRLKGERMPKTLDKTDFTTRWKTIQDLCSVIACHSAFEDCMDGDTVGLGGRHFIINCCHLQLSKRTAGR
jgi:hypothetical protein